MGKVDLVNIPRSDVFLRCRHHVAELFTLDFAYKLDVGKGGERSGWLPMAGEVSDFDPVLIVVLVDQAVAIKTEGEFAFVSDVAVKAGTGESEVRCRVR